MRIRALAGGELRTCFPRTRGWAPRPPLFLAGSGEGKFLYPPGMAAAAAAAAASSNDAGASSGLGVGWAAFGSSVRFAPAPANYKNSRDGGGTDLPPMPRNHHQIKAGFTFHETSIFTMFPEIGVALLPGRGPVPGNGEDCGS